VRPALRDWYDKAGAGGRAAAVLEQWVGAAGKGKAGGGMTDEGEAMAVDDEDADMSDSGNEDDSS